VDNGSSDGSVERISDVFPKVCLLPLEANLGFAEANNRGIEWAMRRSADYVLLLNNDTVVHPEFLNHLVEVAESDPLIGIAGVKIYYYDQPNVIWTCYTSFDWLRGEPITLDKDRLDSGQCEIVRSVDYITGCALLVKTEVISKIGLMDPRYFLYFEDVDWSVRATQAGYRCVCVPQAVVWHKVNVSSKGKTLMPRTEAYYYYTRNNILFMRANAPYWAKSTFWPFFLARTLITLLRIVGSRWVFGKRNVSARVGAVIAGCWDGILGRSGQRGVKPTRRHTK